MVDIHGSYDPAFRGVKDKLVKQIRKYGGGAGACVYYHGEKVMDIWGGVAGNDNRPWQEDTVSLSYSATKAVPVTLVHMLVTDGLIDYDEPVATYWPEFGELGKESITVRQLLSHQAGLYQVRGLIERPSDVLDWDAMIESLAGSETLHKPGSANGYHAFNIGWLTGALIEKVSGMPFKDFLHERLRKPLGLDGLIIGAEDEELSRIADIMGQPSLRPDRSRIRERYPVPDYVPAGPVRRMLSRGLTPKRLQRYFGDREFYKACIPAANGVFDARSLAKMYAMLANMGEWDGVRYIDKHIINQARQVQTKRFDKVVVYPMHWRLGYHRADAITKNYPSAFGHYGFAGAGGWCNPEYGLSFALVHNSSIWTLSGHIRCIAITGSVYEGAKKAG